MPSAIFGTPFEANERFRTLELAATASHEPIASARIARRLMPANHAGPEPVRLRGSAGNGGDDTPTRYTWRVWWAPPSLWRDDLTWPNGQTTVIILREDAAIIYVSMQRILYTSEPLPADGGPRVRPHDGVQVPTIADRVAEFPLFRPWLSDSEWEVATLGQEAYMGRVARHVRATRRAGSPPARMMERWRSWLGLDEYDCLVDDGLQILVRLTGIDEGVPVATIFADHLYVDAPLPADIFAFEPPPGTRIAHVARPA